MTRTRIASLVLAAAAIAAPLAHAGEVVLYSSNTVDAINAATEEFNKKYPDIKITAVRGSTGAPKSMIAIACNSIESTTNCVRRVCAMAFSRGVQRGGMGRSRVRSGGR